MFLFDYCIIQDEHTSEVKGVGKVVKGLYHLLNQLVDEILRHLKQGMTHKKEALAVSSELIIPTQVVRRRRSNMTTLWHKRMGYALMKRIKKISRLKGFDTSKEEVCLTCPLTKFTKLPFEPSQSRVA